MYLKFWGTRGSIPMPGPSTVRYGGNTSCVEFRSSAGTLIVIDCGTGGHNLGLKLFSEGNNHHGHMLISHTHWDHIQGIPFFTPFFVRGEEWDIYGPKGLSQSIKDTLAGQMQHIYFPVNISQLGATMRYHNLVEGSFEINDIKVTVHYLNHTMLTIGYRLEADGVVIVYSCDHEPYSRLLATDDKITGQDLKHADFLANADLVIHDSQYTVEEYATKIGWGHSPVEYVVKICQLAGVKALALSHHDPLRDDDTLEKILKSIHEKLKEEGSVLEVFAAAEGQEIQLIPTTDKPKVPSPKYPSANSLSKSIISEQSILIYVSDPKTVATLSEAVLTKGIHAKLMRNVNELKKHVLSDNPALILIEHKPPLIDGLKICREITKGVVDTNDTVPIVIVAEHEDHAAGAKVGVTDWLITPFSISYAQSKIHAWVLREACRWIRAPIPKDEDQRLASFYKLMISDQPEERFNRITRIVAALFDMPFSLISFVDRDRQWFKSCWGINIKESSRELSFCAHVVNSREVIVVSDTFQDDRFADHPFVLREPRIRFYAGCPLLLDNGYCIGTLCCLDIRPRFFQEKDMKLLLDLRDLTMQEIYAHQSND